MARVSYVAQQALYLDVDHLSAIYICRQIQNVTCVHRSSCFQHQITKIRSSNPNDIQSICNNNILASTISLILVARQSEYPWNRRVQRNRIEDDIECFGSYVCICLLLAQKIDLTMKILPQREPNPNKFKRKFSISYQFTYYQYVLNLAKLYLMILTRFLYHGGITTSSSCSPNWLMLESRSF